MPYFFLEAIPVPFEGEGLCEESVEVSGPWGVFCFSLPLIAGGETLTSDPLGVGSVEAPGVSDLVEETAL